MVWLPDALCGVLGPRIYLNALASDCPTDGDVVASSDILHLCFLARLRPLFPG